MLHNIVSNIQQILILLYNFPIQLYKLSGFYIMKRDGILMNFFAQDLLAHLFQVDTVQGQHANEKTSDWNNFNTDTKFLSSVPTYILNIFIDCVIYITFYWFRRRRQSPKNMGNLRTRFLRKVSKREECLTRISRINVAKTVGIGCYKMIWSKPYAVRQHSPHSLHETASIHEVASNFGKSQSFGSLNPWDRTHFVRQPQYLIVPKSMN